MWTQKNKGEVEVTIYISARMEFEVQYTIKGKPQKCKIQSYLTVYQPRTNLSFYKYTEALTTKFTLFHPKMNARKFFQHGHWSKKFRSINYYLSTAERVRKQYKATFISPALLPNLWVNKVKESIVPLGSGAGLLIS